METIKKLIEIKPFNEIIKKITLDDKDLNDNAKKYLLTIALVFLKEFDYNTTLNKKYLEFGYYIILKYSILFKDFKPLYDFTLNFGFYPIASIIAKNNLIDFDSLININLEERIEKDFKNGVIIETLEQNKMRKFMVNNDYNIISLVAPTSFGKSSLIIQSIKNNLKNYKKIAIIVPTKSLLAQTYKLVKNADLNRRIIIHDTMYQNDNEFIAIFTQERALRLLNLNKNISYDCLYIEEAHKIFNKDMRSIFLSRLIKINKIRNQEHKIIYLSPLIFNSENLKLDAAENVKEKRISFNIKEPEYYELKLDLLVYKYNRFINQFYEVNNKIKSFFDYIFFTQKKKNFIYINTPKKIELFAKELFNKIENKSEDEWINETIAILTKYVHKEFYANEYLKKGIIYIHAKLLDNIKEYLEHKFTVLPNISYLIANQVILEGVNLPIENIYIFSIWRVNHKDLTNLVGRSNRLKNIFDEHSNLYKLLPQIHFINTEKYNQKNSNMTNKIISLCNTMENDEIKNPILYKFDKNKMKKNDLQNIEKIINNEQIIFNYSNDPIFILKKKIIEFGLNNIFSVEEELCMILHKRLQDINEYEVNCSNIIEKIYDIFVKDLETFISDFEFKRLKNLSAVNYYKIFLENSRNKTIQQNIIFLIKYFKKRIEENNSIFYFGIPFGEISAFGGTNKVYINLNQKNEKELINLSIIKLKMENDFVSYKLFLFFDILFDYKKISIEEYNKLIFGTNDQEKLKLIKLGLNLNIINKLEKDKQLVNIYIDENNNIKCKEAFEKYKNSVDDFIKFELSKIF